RAGHRGPAYVRHAGARTPATRLVPGASPAGSEPHYARVARAPIYPESSGHFCFLDMLDVALGCARRVVISANPGFNQSRLRPRSRDVTRERTPLPMSQQ